MISFTSPTVWPVRTVIGSTIIPDSDFLTFCTSMACSSMDMFLWIMPMPPSRAMVMAVRCSVTVSMAALIKRNIEWDIAGQPGGQIDLGRQNFRGRNQKQIVKGIGRSDFIGIHHYFSVRNEHGWSRTAAAADIGVRQAARAAKSGKARPPCAEQDARSPASETIIPVAPIVARIS